MKYSYLYFYFKLILFIWFISLKLIISNQEIDFCKCKEFFKSNIHILLCRPDENNTNVVSYSYSKRIGNICQVNTIALLQFDLENVQMIEFSNVDSFTLSRSMTIRFSVSTLRIRSSQISDMLCSDAFGDVINLDLSSNEIQHLNILSGKCQSKRLERIDLSANKISYMAKDYFKALGFLKYLNLSKNRLLSFDLIFDLDLSILEIEINISHNIKLDIFSNLEFGHRTSENNSLSAHFIANDIGIKTIPVLNADNFTYLSFSTNFYEQIVVDFRVDIYLLKSLKKTSVECSIVGFGKMPKIDSFRQEYFFNLNLSPFDLKLEQNEFTSIPNMSLLSNLTRLFMNENLLDRLHDDKKLPKRIELLDFSFNKIESITATFFLHFSGLTHVSLAHNMLVILNRIEFISNKLQVISFADNNIEYINNLVLRSFVKVNVEVIDLSGNKLKYPPKIKGNQVKIMNMNLSNQRSNAFINGRSIQLLLSNMPPILNHLSLRNNSLDSINGKLKNPTAKSIDLSFNNLSIHVLCDLFSEISDEKSLVVFSKYSKGNASNQSQEYIHYNITFSQLHASHCKFAYGHFILYLPATDFIAKYFSTIFVSFIFLSVLVSNLFSYFYLNEKTEISEN